MNETRTEGVSTKTGTEREPPVEPEPAAARTGLPAEHQPQSAQRPHSPGATVVEGLVTVGWAGKLPYAPGTAGALVSLPLAWLLALLGLPWYGWAVLLLALSLAGVWLVDRYLLGRPRMDPPEVVLDELVGCLITLAFVPWHWAWVIAGFLLFRLLDIVKPGPIRTIDRRTHGGIGVMGDDVAAGLLGGLLLGGLNLLGRHQGWWG